MGWQTRPSLRFLYSGFSRAKPTLQQFPFGGEGISDKFSDDPLYLKRSSETGGASLFETQCTAQLAQVFGKGVNRCLKGFAVFVAEFVVGFKAVFGFVFGEDVGDLFEVGIDFLEQGFVFLGNHRTEEFDDFLRAFDVGLEVAQVGMAVTV